MDNLFNLYIDDINKILEGTFKDPAAISFIEKGADYRDKIVAEVNDVAVIRSKAVNIRDYTSALMFDEERTRLYYTIRAIQDYISEGRIKISDFDICSDLVSLINSDKKSLICAYHSSTTHTIVDQILHKKVCKKTILDYFSH